MPSAPYASDGTDAERLVLEPLIPVPKPGGRPARHDRRAIVNAIRYVVRGGIAWRSLPHEFPPWQTVCHHFRRWSIDGT